MALLDRVAANLSSGGGDAVRADPVSLEEFGYLLGAANRSVTRSKAGVDVGPKRVLGISAWYSGVRYLAETIAGLPVHTYRDTPAGRLRRADPQWKRQPDVEQTWFGLVEAMMMSLLHKGDSFSFKMRNPVGQVVGLREIHPDRVTVGQAPDGTKRFLVDHDETVYTTREILHIPGLAYNGRRGLNPIQTAADALGGIAAVEDYTQRFFANGTHVGGVISFEKPLDSTAVKRLRAEWDEFHQGLRTAHQTGVLSAGARYDRISLDAKDTQLLEERQYGVTEVARLLRIPPHKLYDLTRATFSNIEHQSIEAVVDSIRPWLTRLEAWVNADPHLLPAGNFIEFQIEGLLRGDAASRAQFHNAGITGGWQTPAGAARLENLPAPAELDYYLRPLNMAVIREGQPDQVPADSSSAAPTPITGGANG